jgi:predicted nucleic acid-binding protein
MILLDTNVVSEMTRPQPDLRVVSWLDVQKAEDLYLSSVSLAELLLGISLLPDGRRKDELTSILHHQALPLFEGRILSFDPRAAAAYAAIIANARRNGVSIGIADGQIAATALVNGGAIATRDTAPFRATDLQVINPWEWGTL